MSDAPPSLRVALLTYRGKPHCGGQGIYTRHLSKALVDLGHHVEVYSGPPYPEVDPRVPLHIPHPRQLKTRIDVGEMLRTLFTGTFAEPWAFSKRAERALLPRRAEF